MSEKQDRHGARTASDLERKYNMGSFAEVYGLASDAQKTAESAVRTVENLDSEEIFNRLTNNGELQGIYREDDEIYINANYIKSGKLAAEHIDAENLKVSAANITDTLKANQIKMGGEMMIYEDLDSDAISGKIGYFSTIANGSDRTLLGLHSENDVLLSSAGMGFFQAEDDIVITATGNILYGVSTSTGSHQFTGRYIKFNGSNIHQSSSDRRLKSDINYEQSDKLVAMFDQLKPVTFYMDGMFHMGFVAQDIVVAAENAGLSGVLTDIDCNGMYNLNYGEITAMLTAKIKQLEREIQAMKNGKKVSEVNGDG